MISLTSVSRCHLCGELLSFGLHTSGCCCSLSAAPSAALRSVCVVVGGHRLLGPITPPTRPDQARPSQIWVRLHTPLFKCRWSIAPLAAVVSSAHTISTTPLHRLDPLQTLTIFDPQRERGASPKVPPPFLAQLTPTKVPCLCYVLPLPTPP